MVSTRSSSAAFARRSESPPLPPPKTPRRNARSRKSATPAPSSPTAWSHAPSTLSKVWLAVSLPLVAWDTGYVLLRPHSMPGGSLHWPLWTPYALYGEVDHMYGLKQWSAGNGFTAAQGLLNLVESTLYVAYLWLWFAYAVPAASKSGRKALSGRTGGVAVLVAFSAAVMTLSKTVLYWLNEYYSGWDNIGHNTVTDLIFLWIIPNGAWLVFPTILIATLGSEIVNGLAAASDLDIKTE